MKPNTIDQSFFHPLDVYVGSVASKGDALRTEGLEVGSIL